MFLKRADRLALVDFENRHISYTDLVNNVKYFSDNVVEVEKNCFAIIAMENRTEWIYSFFALWDKGAVPIVLDAFSSPDEFLHVLKDSNPRVIICSNETEPNIVKALETYSLKDEVKVINVDKNSIDESVLENIKKDQFELVSPEGDAMGVML